MRELLCACATEYASANVWNTLVPALAGVKRYAISGIYFVAPLRTKKTTHSISSFFFIPIISFVHTFDSIMRGPIRSAANRIRCACGFLLHPEWFGGEGARRNEVNREHISAPGSMFSGVIVLMQLNY